MLNRFTIKGGMYLIIVSILVLFILMVVFAVNTSNKAKNIGIKDAGHAMLEDQKSKIKVATHSMGVAISNMIKDEGTEQEKIQMIRKLLAGVRFEKDKSGYFFVNKGTTVIFHIKESLWNKNLNNFKDKNGILLFQELTKKAKNGGGFVNYIWDKPGKGDTEKLSYAEMIPGTDFWIGTGVYIDNIEATKSVIADDINASIKSSITNMIIISGVIFAAIIVLCLIVVFGISSSLNAMIVNFKDVTKGDGDLTKRIKIDSKDELATLAGLFNLFMEKLQKIIQQLAGDSKNIDNSSTELANVAQELTGNAEKTSDLVKLSAGKISSLAEEMRKIVQTFKV